MFSNINILPNKAHFTASFSCNLYCLARGSAKKCYLLGLRHKIGLDSDPATSDETNAVILKAALVCFHQVSLVTALEKHMTCCRALHQIFVRCAVKFQFH